MPSKIIQNASKPISVQKFTFFYLFVTLSRELDSTLCRGGTILDLDVRYWNLYR